MLAKIEDKFGSASAGVIVDTRFAGDIYAWRDEIAATRPREADNRMVIFSRLLSWAKKRHLVNVNLLEGYERIHRSDRSEMIWLPEHIEAFQKVAAPEIWAVFLVALHTGLRQGNLCKLPWSAYDGTALELRVKKRRKGTPGVLLRIPCTSALKSLLQSLPRRGPLILTTKTGKAWKKRYVCRRFDEAREAATKFEPDVVALNFHDIRGTAITLLAEAGASIPEIAAITGHKYKSITSILEKYLPRTRHLAEMAIAKLENSERTKFANYLQTAPFKKSTGGAK